MATGEKSNIKLGLFVLAGSFLLILTLYMIGKNQNIFGSNFELRARFRNVNGLTAGNNIRFSGIQVGTVKKIKVLNDTTIEVTMLVNDDMKTYIHRNARASIGTEGLMGNKIINILPSDQPGLPVAQGDLLPVNRSVNTDEMLQTLSRTNENIEEISEGLQSAVQRLNNSKALWAILGEASLAANLKISLQNISLASARASGMMADLHSMVADIKNGKGSVGAILTDTGFAVSLRETVAKIGTIGDRASGLADQLDKISASLSHEIDSGKGPVNALLKDPSIVVKLHATLDNVQKGTAAFSEDMEALKHNFLFRGYFRRLDRQQKKQARDSVRSLAGN